MKRRISVMVAALTLPGLVLGGLAGCGADKSSDAAYCEAIKADPGVDAPAMLAGDKEALNHALETYRKLRDLAPSALTKQWAQIVRDLESMLKAANGDIEVSETDYPGFRDALADIEEDQTKRCK